MGGSTCQLACLGPQSEQDPDSSQRELRAQALPATFIAPAVLGRLVLRGEPRETSPGQWAQLTVLVTVSERKEERKA